MIEKELAKKRVIGAVLFDLATSEETKENRYFHANFDGKTLTPLNLSRQESSHELEIYSATIVEKNAHIFPQGYMPYVRTS